MLHSIGTRGRVGQPTGTPYLFYSVISCLDEFWFSKFSNSAISSEKLLKEMCHSLTVFSSQNLQLAHGLGVMGGGTSAG